MNKLNVENQQDLINHFENKEKTLRENYYNDDSVDNSTTFIEYVEEQAENDPNFGSWLSEKNYLEEYDFPVWFDEFIDYIK